MNWYYDAGSGNRQGPVTEAALDELLAAGAITLDTLVWRQGMADWAPMRTARGGGSTDAPSTERCDACGLFFPTSELIKIGQSNVCASCKPGVLQQLQQGGELPALGRTGPAWEQRQTMGTLAAAMATIKAVLMTPSEAFSTMKREGGVGKPLLYHMFLGTVGGIASLLYNIVFNSAVQQPQQPSPIPGFTLPVITNTMMFGWGLMLPFLIALGAFINAGIFHVSLMICGGARQPFETTFRVVTYAAGSAAIFQIVPFCGALVSAIWGVVCLCIGMARAHEIGTGRAVCAVVLPLAVCCIGFIALFAAIFATVAAAQGAH